jgi:hypothetical protein
MQSMLGRQKQLANLSSPAGILRLFYLFIYFAVLGLKLRAYTLSHYTSPFGDGFFRDRFSQTICSAVFEL